MDKTVVDEPGVDLSVAGESERLPAATFGGGKYLVSWEAGATNAKFAQLVAAPASGGPTTALEAVQAAIELLQGLPTSAFTKPVYQDLLVKKLEGILRLIEAGKLNAAINRLTCDVLPKLDGVGRDWISDPDARQEAYDALMLVVTFLMEEQASVVYDKLRGHCRGRNRHRKQPKHRNRHCK